MNGMVLYELMLAASMLMTVLYAAVWHKHFDAHITLIFTLAPVSILGNVMLARAHSLDEALAANKIIYIGGCYLLLLVMLNVFSMCHIRLHRPVTAALMILTTIVYCSVLTLGTGSGIFYRYAEFEIRDGVGMLVNKQYGPMHTCFLIMLLTYFALTFGAIFYSYFRKRDVSRRIIHLLVLPALLSAFSYFAGKIITPLFEMLPFSFVFAQVVYLIIIHRICLYDITDSGIDSLVQKGDTGFISFDFKYNYLGSNETAQHIFPELTELTVDKPAARSEKMQETALKWLDDFRKDETKNKTHYKTNGRIYLVSINYLTDGRRRRGYQFFLTDDTKNQQLLSLLERYNTDLRDQVEQKTAHIVEMHDRLIMSMAMMVESRDNSTGGHIRRTSDVVRLLVEEIQQSAAFPLSDDFCKNLIKAAPMHDLGKIAVDDAVLRKPGRFTPEEFEKMKAHAAEGARIVHNILENTDDFAFHLIAENVAHYHHERWDGSGYPEHLKGEEIPLEARIMAIADVYDALVSKRVYKESMSFEQADAIIREGMGKHFDSRLEPYYLRARPKIEDYYRSAGAAAEAEQKPLPAHPHGAEA